MAIWYHGHMLPPFERLAEAPAALGPALPLPPELADLYGPLSFPAHAGSSHIIANFVSTLDGVVSLGAGSRAGGPAVSGANEHDRALMGLLRAAADAVVVGAGTLRAVPRHVWTAGHIYPPLARAYAALRAALHKPPEPLSVFVSGTGAVDLGWPAFAAGPALVVTTPAGARRVAAQAPPAGTHVAAVAANGSTLSAAGIVDAVERHLGRPDALVLVEGGPALMGTFFAERRLHELFLTLAPQVAGRGPGAEAAQRPGLVAGKLLAPEHAAWGRLLSVRRAGSHLFLRFQFAPEAG